MNNKEFDITKSRVPFNWMTFIAIIFFAITSTFTVTTIYNNFLLMSTNHHNLEIKVDENNKNQTRRLDTKTDRNKREIDKLRTMYYELEEKYNKLLENKK